MWTAQGPEILGILAREKVDALYHFTSIENLPTIAAAGALCSKERLEQLGYWPPKRPGGNDLSHDLDRQKGTWNHLALNFTPKTPMAYRRKPVEHLCFFVIDPVVAGLPGVLFAPTNAASSSCHPESGASGLRKVNFEAIRSTPRPADVDGWLHPVQAEVLVPGQVEMRYVRHVAFVSRASLQEAERLWGDGPHPAFVVDQSLFEDMSNLTYPILQNLALTSQAIDSETDWSLIVPETTFSRSCPQITLVCLVAARAGTSAVVTWEPSGKTTTTTFPASSRYKYWPSLHGSDLTAGSGSVTVELRGLRWATLPFTVED